MQFLDLPNCPVEEADIIILPVAYDRTVTYNKGTAKGPKAILDASAQLEFYEEDMAWSPLQFMKICVLPQIEDDIAVAEADFHQGLYDCVSPLPAKSLFIGLGGEHSITPDMVRGRMPDGGTIVHIDAHADFRASYHGSIYNHACPINRLRRMGYDVIQLGIRSLNSVEARELAADSHITTWFDRMLQKPSNWQAMLEQLNNLSGDVWFTVDFDGFDPALVGGVGTPQPGGLSWHQGLDVLETLTHNPKINLRGIDLLELIPEPSCVSDMMAAKFVQKCLSYWGKAKGFDSAPKQGSQAGINDE